MPHATFVSFRFSPTDGVSVVTRTWVDALCSLGFTVSTVTGDAWCWPDVDHHHVTGLGIDDATPVHVEALSAALHGTDLVVVENLLTIPVNLAASRAVAGVLAGRPTLVHHHDPPWHRARFAHVTELPATDPAWRHVAINRTLCGELGERGIEASVIYNAFPAPGCTDRSARRVAVRSELGLSPDEWLVAHPVRAIERKNVPAAIELAEALGATYWLLGPAEEGYGPTLATMLTRAGCRVIHRPWHDTDDIYAAADHVAFPSSWEGFGNPPLEAALRRRTVTVGRYPVADELRDLGFRWFEVGDVDGVRRALEHPDDPGLVEMLDTDEHLARTRFSTDRLLDDLRTVLDGAGWGP